MTATRTVRRTDFLPAAEVALTVVTLATIAGMWRLFVDGSFFVPLALHAIAAHVLAAGLRRQGIAPVPSASVCLVVGVLALTWGHLLDATSYGFPTSDTLSEASNQFELAWRSFGDIKAPAPVLDGFLLSAGAAIWVGAWLADLAAFRLWTPFEALIPSGTLFLFASLFSADRARPLAAALWLTTALAFVLVHRCARQQASPAWVGSDARAGNLALLRVGATASVLAVALGWVVGPNLPGAEADPVVAVGADAGGGSRSTVSPLVEINRRLIEQSQTELFTVEVDPADRQYWRLTALDVFDGEIWWSRGSYGEAGGDLGDGSDADLPAQEIDQRFEILALSTIWLPAAYEVADLEVDGTEVRWDEVTSTLIVGREEASSDQLTYDVTSAVVAHDAAALANASGSVPSEVAEKNVDLPASFPDRVRDEARRILAAAGATTPYQQARALQDSFHDGSFEYSLDAPAGHSDSAIEDFLFNSRAGYCEQFAGTYAAMARAVGLPARVAVGFTPGDPDPTNPGRLIVRGEHAHAWPEVYLAGVGWVAFEPTPGRGAPGAQPYTGRPESQDLPGASTQPSVEPGEALPGEVPPPGDPDATIPAQPTIPAGERVGEVDSEGQQNDLEGAARVALLVLLAATTVALLLVVAGAVVAAVRTVQHHRRRRAAASPEAEAHVAFSELEEALALEGIFIHPWETRQEFGVRVANAVGAREAARLGQILTRAEFDPAGIAPEEAAEAASIVEQIAGLIRHRTTWWRRAVAAGDPRSTRRRAAAARGRGKQSLGPRVSIRPALMER